MPCQIFGGTIRGAKYGIWISNSLDYGDPIESTCYIRGVTIEQPGTAGIYLEDARSDGRLLNVKVSHGTTIIGGETGVLVKGGQAFLDFAKSTQPALQLRAQTGKYIILQSNGNTSAGDLDATADHL